jgi:small subunit ribosomal protein S17
MKPRGKRKTAVGVVTSTKMQKTITVEAETLKKHPRYKKYIRHYTTYKVHDEEEKAAEGDVVEIMEARPVSKTKRWRLLRIVKSKA